MSTQREVIDQEMTPWWLVTLMLWGGGFVTGLLLGILL